LAPVAAPANSAPAARPPAPAVPAAPTTPRALEPPEPPGPPAGPELDELRDLQQRLQQQLAALRPAEPGQAPSAPAEAPVGFEELRERLEARLTDIDGMRQDLISFRREAELQWTQLASICSTLQDQLRQRDAATPADPAELKSTLAGLADQVARHQARLEQLGRQAAPEPAPEADFEALRTEVTRLIHRLNDELERRLATLESQVQQLGNRGADRQLLRQRLAELEANLVTLRAELESLPSEAPDLRDLELEPDATSASEGASTGEVESFWKRLFKEPG
jgi:chromosome segregation ATPase